MTASNRPAMFVRSRDRRPLTEPLEQRRLLSAVVASVDIPTSQGAQMDWATLRHQDGLRVVSFTSGGETVDAVAGQFVAQLDAESLSDARNALRPLGLKVTSAIGRDTGMFVIQAPLGVDFDEVSRTLKAVDSRAIIEPDLVFTTNALEDGTPNDPRFTNGDLWGLRQGNDVDVDADEAWMESLGANVVVGVIDSSVDYTHPDLAANIWTNPGEIAGNGIDDDGNGFIDDFRGWDFARGDNDVQSEGDSHGTHVSGTIAAVGDNGIGVVGVAPRAKILPIKVGFGGSSLSGSGILAGMYYLADFADAGVNIVATNNSYGGGGYSSSFYSAISSHNDRGILFVASAGNSTNDNDVNPHYPDGYNLPNVISVASHTSSDQLSGFSSFGATTVDLAAPGSSILSTVPGGGYSYFNGTSMASPHVAGAVAALAAANPSASAAEIKAAILDGAVPSAAYAGKTLSGGRLNVSNSLDLFAGPNVSTPTNVRLKASSDTGVSNSDNITRDRTPSFEGVADASARIELFANGVLVGNATANGSGIFAVTAVATVPLNQERVVAYTMIAYNASNEASAPTQPINVTIDTLKPSVVSRGVVLDFLPHRLVYQFSEDQISLRPGYGAGSFTTTGATTSSVAINGDILVAEFNGTTAYLGGMALPNGDYSTKASSAMVQDRAGNVGTGSMTASFFVLNADANRDRRVNLADRDILLAHWGELDAGHSLGDFNYDGVVNQLDLDRWTIMNGTVLAAPRTGGGASTPLI